MHKSITLFLSFCFILTLSSLIVIETTVATSTPKPSIPEFTVNLIDSSYDTQPTASIDPYTGQTVTHPSQHIEARTIELRIKHVPFTPFEIENGSNMYTVNLHYNIRWKGHFEGEWHEIYIPMNGYAVGEIEGNYYVVSYQGNYSSTEGLLLDCDHFRATFPPNAQVDFQVEALIGYIHHVVALPVSAEVFEGQTSGWSSTQTLTITQTAQTPTPSISASPTPQGEGSTPSQTWPETSVLFDFDWIAVIVALLVIIAVTLVFVVVYLRRRRVG